MRRLITLTIAVLFGAIAAPSAFGATATPFGGTTVSGGVATLVSNTGDASSTNDSSGVTFAGTGVTTFASLTMLSTEFDVTDDDCKAGSPRFQIRVQTPAGEKNVFVYLGPTPSFTGCSQSTWIASGNLIGSTDGRFDTSQVQAGGQVSTYAQALALVGSFTVTGISLVVDSGWAFDDKEQMVRARNVKVNASTFFSPDRPKPPNSQAKNAAQTCKSLRAELGKRAFHAVYGTNRNGKNAFGKCVSMFARMSDEARAAEMQRVLTAAEACIDDDRSPANRGKGKHKRSDDDRRPKKARSKGLERDEMRCLRQIV
jgi:hypothetical protein